MYKVTRKAESDLVDIFENAVKFLELSMEKADAYQEMLFVTMEWLGNNPNSGEFIIKEIGLRKWAVGVHTILYTPETNYIVIERIVPQNSWFLQALMN